ncbi:MAG: MFS transporter [Candidatus Bathyarchaeia archaeon]
MINVFRLSNNMGSAGVNALAGDKLAGMLGFTLIWVGQMLSLMGTAMTGFALTIWAWEITGQAAVLALVGFANFAPVVLFSPIAGAIVDRYDRKKVMMLADLAAGLPTVGLLLLFTMGNLQIWHLFITGAISGTFQSFHFPAYSAAVTMMVRKGQYGRAQAMLAVAEFASGIFAPVIAAVMLVYIGIGGIISIDVITFTAAVVMLFFVHVPKPPVTDAGRRGMGSIWKESFYGFRYIYEHPSFLGLQLVFLFNNFLGSFGNTLFAPMILARTGNDTLALGSVMSAGGVGGLIGSIVLTIWGGPKRRIHGVLLGFISMGLLGGTMGLFSVPFGWAAIMFMLMLVSPLINTSNQAIWQAKVEPDVQGRVFSTRRLIAQVSAPPAMLMAGFLADSFFEPGMKVGGSIAESFGWLVGTGPGAGMALMIVITGMLGAVLTLGVYGIRAVRDVETILPDHDARAQSASEKS